MVRGVEKAHQAYQKSGYDEERIKNRARAKVQNRPEQAQKPYRQENARPQHAADRMHSKIQNRPDQPQKAAKDSGARPQHAIDRAHEKYQDRAGKPAAEKTYSNKHGDRAQFSQKAMRAAAGKMGSPDQPMVSARRPDAGASVKFSEKMGYGFGGKG